MRNRLHIGFGLVLFSFIFASCNTWKHVPEGEKYYTGAKLKITSVGRVEGGRKDLKFELEKVVSPEPNTKILGGRFGVWLHFKAQQKVGKKLLKKLDTRFGQEAVYMSDVDAIRNEKILINRLENKGFFGAEVTSERQESERTGSMVYRISVPDPYYVQTFTYIPDSTAIDSLRTALKDSVIKTGTRFDTDIMKKERVRIDEYLKDDGYYHFNADYLNFISDTNHYKDKRFDLYLQVKETMPQEAKQRYRINDITVYTDYSIDNADTIRGDTIMLEGIRFIEGKRRFKPKHLMDYITFRKGYLFSQRTRVSTTRKLASMGGFQYVSIRYHTDTTSTDTIPLLNATIQLTPYKKHTLQMEVQGYTKSTNFAGPALIASFTNRNLFKGGEIFEVGGNASYETQIIKGSTKGLSSFQFKLLFGLTIPRVFPVKIRSAGGYSVPKTRFGFNTSLISRAQYYNLLSFQFEYGFSWNTNRYITQQLNPIDVIYSNVFATTPQFDAILAGNSFLAQSFQDQFIPGSSYTFQYSQLGEVQKKHRFLFKFTADVAGNLIGGIQSLAKEKGEIVGLPYAQYVKGDIDFRHYVRIGRESQWVTRLFTGWSFPYGNSSTLPYIKQYFAGGPNSIRGFQVRSLGPGSYNSGNSGSAFFDQSGDIKIELNTEFRHPIYNILKGAAFVDMGNIWLARKNEALPGGEFTKDWYRQIAMSFGYGLRLDIQFIVIRFDFATPFRAAQNTSSEKWTDAVGVWRGAGFGENVVVNFSIGYPF